MANAKEIKIPIVITADGAKAVAGLQAFKTQANKIDGMFSRWGQTQISSVGGMLFGFLGIASAINGIRQLYAESKKLSELAGTYAPEVIRAQAETQVAEIQKNIEVAKAITPVETRRANIETEDLQKMGTAKESLISSAGLQIDLAFSTAQYRFIAALDFLSGNMDDFAAHAQMAAQRTEEMGGFAARGQNAIYGAANFAQNFTRDEGALSVLRLIEAFSNTQKNIELPENENLSQNFTGENKALNVSEIIQANTKNIEDFYAHSKMATDTNYDTNSMAALSQGAISGTANNSQNFTSNEGAISVLRLIEANTKGNR